MQTNIEIYFLHGWGFESGVWKNWLPQLNSDNSSFIFDRGYFSSHKNNFSLAKSIHPKIVIAHSFGLHYLSVLDLSQIHTLILLGSFLHFHQHSNNHRLAKKKIALMKKQLVIDPKNLLCDFYTNCGITRSLSQFQNINQQLLHEDLHYLDTNQISLDSLKSIKEVILLHGYHDKIVNIQHSQTIHKELPNSKLLINPYADHSLPIAYSQWCLKAIESQLQIQIFNHCNTLNEKERHDKVTIPI